MKLFYLMLVVVLVGAVALPFFMRGPDGKPLATIDGALEGAIKDVIPEAPVEMYRWKNEHGVWEFGEAPPEQGVATKLSVDNSRTTTMGSEWNVAPVIAESRGGLNGGDGAFVAPDSLADAYRAAPELMDAAKRAAALLNERQAGMDESLDGLLEQVREQEGRE